MLILLLARQIETNDPDWVWTAAAGVELLVECLVVTGLVVVVVWS